jgi:outer membrane receptor protein involved in Fe transport
MKRLFTYISLAAISGSLMAQDLRDTLFIDEVVVTGSRIEISRNNMPVNVSVLTKADLNEVEESAVLPLLGRKIPGMFVTESGVTGFGVGSTGSGQINMRGVGSAPNTQVLILVDGQPQYMGIFGHPLPNSYVASDMERVEVIKGPGSILYGSNAMGGVVNFITKRPETDGFTGNARIAYGSFNTQKYMVNGGYKKNKFSVFGSINRDKTDGHRDSSSFNITNAYGKLGYKVHPALELIADFTIAEFLSLDPGRDFENPPVFIADIVRGKASFTIKNDFDISRGSLYAFYNFGDHELSDGWRSHDVNYGISLFQGIELPYNSLLTMGVDYKSFGGRGSLGMSANQWKTISETGVYAIMRHEILDVLNLSYGIRREDNSIYGDEWVPQGGISWNALDETTLKLSISKGFRSPTLMETYVYLPNPLLEPERMMNYELSLSQSLLEGKLLADASVFLLEGSNIIQVQPNALPPPPSKRVNTGEFSNKGFEIEFNYRLNKQFSSHVSYSFLHTEKPLLAAPGHQLFGGMNYRIGKFGTAIQGHYVGGLISNLAASDSKENYVLLNASLRYKPVSLLEVFVSGKNLLNQKYQINNGYPMPGVHFMAGINFSL